MARKIFGLGICGLDAHDEVWIRAVLSVALPNLRHDWEITPLDRAEVLICRPDSMLWPEVKQRSAQLILILHHGERPIPGALTLHAPLRSASLLSLLNHCGDQLQSKHRFFGSQETSSKNSDAGMMLPSSMNWLRDLHQLLIAGQDAAILIDGRHCYSVTHRNRRLYYVNREAAIISAEHLVYAWSKEAAEGFPGWRAVALEQCDSHATLANHDPWPLEQLLWKLGHLLSQQQLLPQASLQHAFQLCRWPDYGLIGTYHSQFLLTAALVQQALSLTEIKQVTQLNETQIHSLLHSALCCNLLLETDSPALMTHTNIAPALEAPALSPELHTMTRMLGVLRQALGLRGV